MGFIFQLTHTGTAFGQQFNNVAYWRAHPDIVDPMSDAYLQALCDELAGRYATWYAPLFNVGYAMIITRLREVLGYSLQPLTVPEEDRKPRLTISRNKFKTPLGAVSGIVTGDPLPNTVAAVNHWDTGRYGRRRRGRWKLGPMSKSDASGNQMITATRTSLVSAAEAYRAPALVGSPIVQFDMVVFSQTGLFETAAPGEVWDHIALVENETIPLTFGTQRTRKYGVGAM